MQTFASSFITGFSSVIETQLLQDFPDLKIIKQTDGIIIYTTNASIENIKKVSYLNNTFLVIRFFEAIGSQKIQQLIKAVLHDPDLASAMKEIPKKKLSFRVYARDLQVISIDKNLLAQIEKKLVSISGYLVDRANPEVEFWFQSRREGYGFFGLRLTKRGNYEKVLAKGEIYPELATLLCLISDPQATDIFLDPFAGSGAIPFQRGKLSPSNQILIGEKDHSLVEQLQLKAKTLSLPSTILKGDALNLNSIKNDSIDKIVTDPPWGLHSETELAIDIFYAKMLDEFYRILKSGGLIVLLTSQKEVLESLLNDQEDRYRLLERYDTLVSGQKAGVFKIQKISN